MPRTSSASRSRRVAITAAVAAVTAALGAAAPADAAISDFPLPTPDAGLEHIVTGKDGSLWFSEQKAGKVGRITTSGQISEWTIPRDGEFGPEELTVGADGRIWTLSDAHKQVYAIDPNVPNVPVLAYELSGQLRGDDITTAPDGSIWITDSLGEGVTRIVGDQVFETAGGAPDCSFDGFLTAGPDGRVWCAFKGDALKRIEPDGVNATNFPTPTGGFQIQSLTTGPDRNLWYGKYLTATFATPPGNGTLGRMTPTGQVQEFPLGDRVAPDGLTAGPDGAVWFTNVGPDGGLGRVSSSGQVKIGALGVRKATDIAFGGDRALWFIDENANRVSRVPLAALPGAGAPAPTLSRSAVRARRNRVSVKVACPKAATEACRGSLRLRTASKVRLRGGKSRKVRTVTGAATYSVAPGKAERVRAKVGSTGRSVLRGRRSVKVAIQATPRGASAVGASRTVTLRG